jgi:predicted PurR-regulated permease PerM
MMTPDDGPPPGGASSDAPVDPGAAPVATTASTRTGMPRWLPRGIALFWLGLVALVVLRWLLGKTRGLLVLLLISLFLALAVEPGVNLLARRGWRRGRATGLVLLLVFLAAVVLLGTVGTLVGRQVADLLTNSEDYVNQVVDFLNDNFGTEIDPQTVIDEIEDEDGAVQEFIRSQSDEALRLSVQALGFVLQVFSVILFTYYLVADGPRLRRSICSRLPPERQRRVLEAWNLAIEKTGGYLYSRGILAILSAVFHSVVFWIIDLPASIALGIWVGVVSQFLPVIGTYLAGLLPVLVALIEDPRDVIVVLIAVVVYQQIENYLFLPRITARTLDLHPAVAFGAALFGAAILGAPGAILALPAAATLQAFAAQYGAHHEVVDDELTRAPERRRRRSPRRAR